MNRLLFYSLLACSIAFSSGAWSQSFSSDPMNAERSKKQDGIWHLSLSERGCNPKDYGDGRGESDCTNGNLQSRIMSGKKFNAPSTVMYEFDVLIEEGFSYVETLPYRKRGSIVLAEWGRVNSIKNHMYEVHLTPNRGVTFEGVVCFSPKSYGKWNTVSVLAKWSNDTDGLIQVSCNDAVIYSRKGPNLVPPGCGTDVKPQCELKHIDLTTPINWKLGPKYYGFGSDYQDYGRSSPFLPFPTGGIDVRVRNVTEKKLRT